MAKYVEMTIEEAIKYSNGKGKVLVAINDLENPADTIQYFCSKTEEECKKIIKESKTIIFYNDFIKQMRLFTTKQSNIMDIVPCGKMGTVLFSDKTRNP